MATSRSPYYNPSSTGWNSYNSGKFRVTLKFSISTAGIDFTPVLNIGTAFKTGHTVQVRWTDENGVWQSSTTTAKYKKKQTKTFATRTVYAQKINVEVKVGSYICTFDEIVNEEALVKPSSITATKQNDSCYQIDVKGTGTVGIPAETIVIERATDTQSSWSSICEAIDLGTEGTGEYEVSVLDEDVDSGHKYWWRAKATNEISGDSGYIQTNSEYTTPTTSETTINSVTRNSNVSCTVNWSISSVSAVSRGIISGFQVLRSVNGGTYNPVGSVVNAVTTTTQYSYTDTSCGVDNKYKYGLQVLGVGGTSYAKILDDTEITMSPNAPQAVTINRNSSDYVVVNIINNSNTATNVCIENNIDGGGWNPVTEEDYPCSQYIDDEAAASDNIVYRVRNKNSDLTGNDMYSAYKESNTLQSKSKPSPPDLISPANGSNITLTDGSVRLVWIHNSTDGSSQENATIAYKINNGSWVNVTETTNSYHVLSLASGFSANDVVSWKVITKGAHNQYSDESAVYTFNIVTKPQLTFTEPDNGDVIDTLPIVLEWNYNDLCGTLSTLSVDIVKDNKTVKTYSVPVGSGVSGTYTYSLAGFLFENDTIYGLRATAMSSNGLSATDNISITVQYEPVSLSGGLLPLVKSDSETGTAQITIARDISPNAQGVVPSPVSISECYLYRKHDGERTLVASGLTDGSFIEDKYAPINVEYEYELLMLTTNGQISIVTVAAFNPSSYWFVYWGNSIAKAIWNPEGSVKLSRPQKTSVRYSGRKYPVTYDQDAMEETFSFTTDIDDREELNNFRQMMRDGGTGIWKSGDGDVYDADFEFSYSSDYTERCRVWKCSLDVTRIDGE